ARFAADLVRRDSLSDRDRCLDRRFGWAYPSAAKAPIGLWRARFYRRADVRNQLCALVLGRIVRVFRAGRDFAGINSDFRNGVRALAFARGTVALAAPARRVCVDRRGRVNLRSPAQFQWLARVPGWPRDHHRRGQCSLFQCVAEIAADGARTGNDGCMANDFRHRATAGDRTYCRWQPGAFSLDRDSDFLPPLSGDRRISTHLFAPLLADAAYVGDEIANHLAHHAAWRDRTRLGPRWRTLVGLVASRCLFRSRRCLDDFPQNS